MEDDGAIFVSFLERLVNASDELSKIVLTQVLDSWRPAFHELSGRTFPVVLGNRFEVLQQLRESSPRFRPEKAKPD
jgi:hypothetical protein